MCSYTDLQYRPFNLAGPLVYFCKTFRSLVLTPLIMPQGMSEISIGYRAVCDESFCDLFHIIDHAARPCGLSYLDHFYLQHDWNNN